MPRYLLIRLGQSLLVLWGAFTASFALLYALPSDAISIKLSGASDTGAVTPAQIAQIRAEYGFDRPLVAQYLDQLGSVVQGDLGTSLVTGGTVTSTLASALPQTLQRW
jgi:peptide/nickel transport system permease protein